MKNLLILPLLFLFTITFAQPAHLADIKSHGETHHKSNLSAEQQATLRVKEMTLALDLNEAQQQQIMQLEIQAATDRKEAFEAGKHEKPKDSTERFEKRSAHLDKQIEYKNKMKTILSKEQFEKWEKSMAMMHKGRHIKGRKHKNSEKKH